MSDPWPRPQNNGIRIATWNVERPSARSWKKTPAQRRQMALVGADIWVLTETRASLAPGPDFASVACPPHPSRRPDADERWVAVWSRWPIQELGVPSPRGSLTTLITTPLGPLVVYGTVLPWANEPGGDGVVRMWREHYAEITRQGAEWAELAADDPARALCVAGDFNQNLDGGRWYGTHEGRRLLLAALQGADLVCCTSSDMVTEGQLRTHHLIDHICLSRSWLQRHSVTVRCWEPVNADGTRMSDHPGVAVDVCPA